MGIFDLTIYDLIRRNAVAFRGRTAWIDENAPGVTFDGFKGEVDRLAGGLQAAGIEKGDRIGVLGKNSLAYFLLYGAAAATGAIVVPINWRLSAEEVAFNLQDVSPSVLFIDDDFKAVADGIQDRLTTVRHVFSLQSMDDLTAGNPAFTPVELASDDGFVIIHTAAVAGRPRGALLSHGNVLCANLMWDCCFDLGPEDVHLNLLPLFHVGGLFMATSSFHAGAANVNMGKFDADAAVALIEEKRVSVFFDFSPILSSILDAGKKAGRDLSSLRAVVGLDTPDTIEAYQAATGGTFYCMYGQTETSCVATYGRYNDRPGSAGRTVPMGDVRLVDDDDRPVPAGQVGEIAMKGPMVFRGYWNLPDDTAETFRNGWHHTGDMGRFDENGFLFYAGRKPDKELIKPGGENVYPAEVEKVILMHSAVEQTVVFGVPDPKWKEGIKAVCRLVEGETLDARALIEFVGERIARYKKPQYVAFVESMPLAEDGSPDRAKVKAIYGGEQH
jgi:acyl-CoA synthetase (AMP-forming)/AMP-acid ligase II